MSFKKESKGEIIICFDGLFSHGGLVDRLKGIISFYEIAKRLDYNFYIHFESPFKLTDFLVPNKVSWVKEDIYYNPKTTEILYLMNNFNVNPYNVIKESNKNRFIIYSNVNYLGHVIESDIEEHVNSKWRDNFNELFKPSKLLNTKLKELSTKSNNVAFHTRFTTLLGDFKDTTKRILTDDEKKNLMRKVLDEINESAFSYKEYNIFIFSDSINFLSYVKEHSTHQVLSGEPKHIDLNNDEGSIESDLKTFIDFYFMSSCEYVFLVQFFSMYNSEFSKYASIVGNVNFNKLTHRNHA